MADKMCFPKTMKEFIDGFSFKDREEIYTNGAELIPVFRVEQAMENYNQQIRNEAITEFAERLQDKVESFQAEINGFKADVLTLDYFAEFVDEIAEEMKKVGAK